MTHLLPPGLLRHFAPRPPLEYAPPLGRNPEVPLGLADSPSAETKRFRGIADVVAELRRQAILSDPAPSSKDAAPLASTNGVADDKAAVKALVEADAEAAKPAREDGEDGEAGEVADEEPKPEPKPVVVEPAPSDDAVRKAARAGLSGMALAVVTADEAELEVLSKLRPGVPDEHGRSYTADDAWKIRSAARKRRKELSDKRQAETFDPNKDENATGDPYKTLFLSRLHPDVTEVELRKEFDMYGRIDKITLVRDKEGKSRKYAFILYERERDMKAAYKDAEGIKILGKRILVDVERGRTVKGWKPMRLGQGLGGRPKPEPKHFFGGGFRGRGGFRGSFRGGPPGRGGYAGGSFNGPPRGGFSGGFNDRGPPNGGFDRGPPGGGFNDRGPPGGFNDRGPPGGGYDNRGPPGPPPPSFGGSGNPYGGGPPSFGGPPRNDGPRGGGIGFQQGGPPSGGGWGGPPKRDFGSQGGGYDDRGDSKRPRY